MRILPHCHKIEVRESPIEGFGVFATDDISSGTILEEVPFILFPRYVTLAKDIFEVIKAHEWVNSQELYLENLRENLSFKVPEKYYFKWHPQVKLNDDATYTVLPLGFGPCYNTSNTSNNADWKIQRDTFVFRAEKDIKKDEEIRTFYGYFLGQDGATFDCDNVFHFAIDMFPNEIGQPIHKVKALRFGNINHFNAYRNNPSAIQFHSILVKSFDGLTIKKISLIDSSGKTLTEIEIPPIVTLTQIYQKIVEIKNYPCPLVKFLFEYTDKESKQISSSELLWKK